jgi:hypothetical protein
MAAAAVPTPVDLDLQQPCTFTGEKVRAKGELSPRDFLLEILRRKSKGSWDDTKTITYIVGCLRGTALRWYKDGMAFRLRSKATYTTFTTDFKVFKYHFCREFGLKDAEESRSTHNLAAQAPDESTTEFADRICSRVNAAAQFGNVEIDINAECPFTPEMFDVTTTPERLQAATVAYLKKYKELLLEKSIRAVSDEYVRTAVADGLADKDLRREVYMLLEQNKRADEVLEYLVSHKHSSKYANTGATKIKRGIEKRAQIAQLDEASEDEESDSATVEKVSAKSKPKKTNKPKKKPASSNVSATGNTGNQTGRYNAASNGDNAKGGRRFCTYCKKPGHTIVTCYAKRFNEENNFGPMNNVIAGVTGSDRCQVSIPNSNTPVHGYMSEVQQKELFQSLSAKFAPSGNANGDAWM